MILGEQLLAGGVEARIVAIVENIHQPEDIQLQ